MDMRERKTLKRLGVIVGAGLVTVGLAAFPAYTGADNGGNGNGNGNGNGHGNGNGNSADDDENDNDNGNGNGGVDHVVICHVPPGNPDNEHTIIVGEPAVDAHVDNHGDSMGPCETTTSSTTSTSTTTTILPTTTTSSTTTSTTTTTSSTTTSTTTTSPGDAPDAVLDIGQATVGVALVPLDVLANDDRGTPLATIVQPTDFDPVGACSGLSFDSVTGLLIGTPTQPGACLFTYEIENTAGFDAAAVLVQVSP
jgi:hypothetical protein